MIFVLSYASIPHMLMRSQLTATNVFTTSKQHRLWLLLAPAFLHQAFGHGSLIYPAPRGGLDKFLPEFSNGSWPSGHYPCTCVNGTEQYCHPGTFGFCLCLHHLPASLCINGFFPPLYTQASRVCGSIKAALSVAHAPATARTRDCRTSTAATPK